MAATLHQRGVNCLLIAFANDPGVAGSPMGATARAGVSGPLAHPCRHPRRRVELGAGVSDRSVRSGRVRGYRLR